VIGETKIGCFVLDNSMRVLTQRTLQTSIGMSEGGGSKPGEQRIVAFFMSLAEKFKDNNDLASRSTSTAERLRDPLRFKLPGGGIGFGALVCADKDAQQHTGLSRRPSSALGSFSTYFRSRSDL
jgi:hypothetical protein